MEYHPRLYGWRFTMYEIPENEKKNLYIYVQRVGFIETIKVI